MYLEISGRQCGKTHRLVEHITDNFRWDRHIWVVCFNRDSCKRIEEMVTHKLTTMMAPMYDIFMDNGEEFSSFKNHIKNRLRGVIDYKCTMIPARGEIEPEYCYVDEFAYIPREQTRVMENAYYCSTPNGVRHELTNRLINYCNTHNISIVHHTMSNEMSEWHEAHESRWYDDYLQTIRHISYISDMNIIGYPKDFKPKNKINKHRL